MKKKYLFILLITVFQFSDLRAQAFDGYIVKEELYGSFNRVGGRVGFWWGGMITNPSDFVREYQFSNDVPKISSIKSLQVLGIEENTDNSTVGIVRPGDTYGDIKVTEICYINSLANLNLTFGSFNFVSCSSDNNLLSGGLRVTVLPPKLNSVSINVSKSCIGEAIELEIGDLSSRERDIIRDSHLYFAWYERKDDTSTWQQIGLTSGNKFKVNTKFINIPATSDSVQRQFAVKLKNYGTLSGQYGDTTSEILTFVELESHDYGKSAPVYIYRSAPKVIGEQSEEWKEQEILNFE